MRRLSAAIRRPVTFALVQVDAAPDLWRELMDESLACRGRGCRPVASGGRPGLRAALGPLHHLLPVRPDPRLPGAEGQGPLPRRPGRRPAHRRGAPGPSVVGARPGRPPSGMDQAYRTTFVLGSPPDYEPGPERSLAGMAAAAGRTPLAMAYDAMLEEDGQGAALRAHPQLLRRRPRTGPRDAAPPPLGLPGWATAAPTAGSSATPSQPTFMLTHWTRDRSRGDTLPLEWW